MLVESAMITIRALLVVAVAIFAFVVDAQVTTSAQMSSGVRLQSPIYKLIAGRDKGDDDGARGSRNAPPVANPNDDDDKPRIRRRPDDQSTRDRIDRGDYYPERDIDRLKGRNFRD
jgi:hypothetical protein